MTAVLELDVRSYQAFLKVASSDEELLERFLRRPHEVLREHGIDVDPSTTAEAIAVFACSAANNELMGTQLNLRDDELDLPFAASCNTKSGTSMSGPVTNATNCKRTCGLC